MTTPFTYQFRVRYAEVDPQAVVFNSRYLEYADVLVTEYFRDRRNHGLPDGLEFHVRRVIHFWVDKVPFAHSRAKCVKVEKE